MYKIKHIGLIPDGARRWATAHDYPLLESYRISSERLLHFIGSSLTLADEVSIYLFSRENLGREEHQILLVMEVLDDFVRNMLPELCRSRAARVVHAGLKRYLSANLGQAIEWLCEETRLFESKKINLLLGYHPLDEIRDACSRTGGQFGIEDFWVSSEVDLVIRTGGGRVMLSNFIPLQCAYSRFYVVEEYFNDFTDEHFSAICYDACSQRSHKGT